MNDDLRNEFFAKGYLKIPPSIYKLDATTVSQLKVEMDRLFQEDYDFPYLYPDEIHWRNGISIENATREICNGWKSNKFIRQAVVCDEQLGKLATSLMGWNACRIGQDDIIHKPPKSSGGVGFHQDGKYISDNFLPVENNSLTLWIALDDADAENGTLQYVPGSHLWPKKTSTSSSTNETTIEKANSHNGDNNVITSTSATTTTSSSSFHAVGDKNSYLLPLKHAAKTLVVDREDDDNSKTNLVQQTVDGILNTIQVVSVPAGEMVVHHQNTWHGSGPNTSPSRYRRSIVVHLLNAEIQWRSTASFKPHYIYGRYYIRGEATPRDDFFPITYSNSNSKLLRTSWLDNEENYDHDEKE